MKTTRKVFNFEIYLRSPIHGQSGWEIKFVNVWGYNESEAREILKTYYPRFDKILTYHGEVTPTDEDLIEVAFRTVPLSEIKQPSFI